MAKNLIVTANDLIWTEGANRGILEAFPLCDCVTSIRNWPVAQRLLGGSPSTRQQAAAFRNLVASLGIRLIDYGLVAQEA